MSRPLDFLVVADHSDNMGFFPKLLSGDPAMLADETGQKLAKSRMSQSLAELRAKGLTRAAIRRQLGFT